MLKFASMVPTLLSVTLAGMTRKLSWPAMPWDSASLSIVCSIARSQCHTIIMQLLMILHIAGGVALSGLTATTSIDVKNVECPSNSTSASQCSVTAPPQSSQCLSNFSAAGIRCIQG